MTTHQSSVVGQAGSASTLAPLSILPGGGGTSSAQHSLTVHADQPALLDSSRHLSLHISLSRPYSPISFPFSVSSSG